MVFELTNDFRQSRGVARIWQCDALISSFCYEHCLAMQRAGTLYHAAECFLNGWGEAVACTSFDSSEPKSYIVTRLIFCIIGNSRSHSELVLSARQLGCAVSFGNDKAYLCIRGKG